MTRMPDTRYIIYSQLGYKDRYDYFTALSQNFNIPIMKIILKAEQLGLEEDFSSLLDWLEGVNKNAI